MINNVELSKQKTAKSLSLALICILFVPNLSYYINVFIQNVLGFEIEFITKIAYITCAVVALSVYLRSCIYKITGSIMIIILGVYLYSFMSGDNRMKMMNGEWYDLVYNPFWIFFIQCVPTLLLTMLIDLEDFIERARKFSFLIVIVLIFVYVSVVRNDITKNIEYMTFSYNLLLPTCFCFYYGLKNKKKSYTIASIVAVGIMIVAGARGAAVSIIIAIVIIYTYVNHDKMTLMKWLFVMFLVVGGIVFSLFFEQIMTLFADFLGDHNIYSRTVDKIIDGTVDEQSGRDRIRTVIYNNFKRMPFMGYGLYGDRIITGGLYANGTYAHNFIVEILCQFGLAPGTMILVFLSRGLYTSFCSRVGVCKSLMIIVFPIFVKLFFSGSYLNDSEFWLFLGAMIRCVIDGENKFKKEELYAECDNTSL